LNAALYASRRAASRRRTCKQFFAAIHNIVGQLMNARNFYIALYDPQLSCLSFPYFVDERILPLPQDAGRA